MRRIAFPALLFVSLFMIFSVNRAWGLSATTESLLQTLRVRVRSASAEIPVVDRVSPVSLELLPEVLPLDELVKRARAGDPSSQVELGDRVAQGSGVKKDLHEARIWFGRAASQGWSSGQMKFAEALRTGMGGSQNRLEAYAWSFLAAAQVGGDDATRAEAIRLRDKIALNMSVKFIQRGRDRAEVLKSLEKPEVSKPFLLVSPVPSNSDYVIGRRLRLALSSLRERISKPRDRLPDPEILIARLPSAPSADNFQSRPPSKTAQVAMTQQQPEPATLESAAKLSPGDLNGNADLETALMKYRRHLHATRKTEPLPPVTVPRTETAPPPMTVTPIVADTSVPVASPREVLRVDEPTAPGNRVANEKPFLGMEEALQRLHELKRKREEMETRRGRERDDGTLLPPSLVKRAEKQHPPLSDEDFNRQLKVFDIRKPRDYRLFLE